MHLRRSRRGASCSCVVIAAHCALKERSRFHGVCRHIAAYIPIKCAFAEIVSFLCIFFVPDRAFHRSEFDVATGRIWSTKRPRLRVASTDGPSTLKARRKQFCAFRLRNAVFRSSLLAWPNSSVSQQLCQGTGGPGRCRRMPGLGQENEKPGPLSAGRGGRRLLA